MVSFYQKYKSTRDYSNSPQVRKDRALRNKNRREFEHKGLVSKGDGKDIDHADGNPRNNARSNLKVRPRSVNRAKH